MFFEEILIDLLEGSLLGEDSTSVGLQMVVVIIAGGKMKSVGLDFAIGELDVCTPSSSTLPGCLRMPGL